MTLAFVIATTLAAGSASAPVAMAQGPAQAPGKATAPSPAPAGVKAIDDILDTAAKAGNFKTLAKVLDAADLTKVLKGKGPFTVFAPTDEAFAKLSKEQTEAILDPKNKRWLVSTLGSHVLSGKILKADRIASTKPTYVKMSNGSLVAIDAKDANAIKFGGATITKADIEASNGVIHVIDSVLLPK